MKMSAVSQGSKMFIKDSLAPESFSLEAICSYLGLVADLAALNSLLFLVASLFVLVRIQIGLAFYVFGRLSL